MAGSITVDEANITEATINTLNLPSGARLVNGELRRSAGQLAGRSEQRSIATWWGYEPGTSDRAVIDWEVAAPAGAEISVAVSHVRAGTARAKCALRADKSAERP